MKSLQTVLFTAYFCLMLIVLGGTIFCVLVEYPNWFANVPSSLEATRNFYKVYHPGYFFQTVAPLSLFAGIGFLITGWRIAGARNYVLMSLAVLIAAELLTFIYIYPRLNVMFYAPDVASHSVETLRQAASEFTNADRIRTVMAFAANALAVGAHFRFFKHKYAMD
ncbi:MAG TPA: hypothetical protein VMZ26_04775 [Pyrinomonadaceae bacterium]|nr:hypothetical protein [Pyrinomonadaceae bacterium]